MMSCRRCERTMKNQGFYMSGPLAVIYTWLCRCGFMTTTREDL